MSKENKTTYEVRYEQLFQMLKDYRSYPDKDPRKQTVDRAITSYRELAGDDETKLRYCAIIEDKYIKPQPFSNRKLATKYFISQRTVMKNVHDGMKELMVLIYGIDGIRWGG